ncbi:hypothetical protein GE061_016050 [Apolygus lucorum]|uniref:Uncharacterized protein n=1 Tax=Apolygus lucorum TaxID=248454 RepID=A0A6A4K6E7_APOLU|nr:hypothetical protein GE061_016050 [Apolygus lucorum]
MRSGVVIRVAAAVLLAAAASADQEDVHVITRPLTSGELLSSFQLFHEQTIHDLDGEQGSDIPTETPTTKRIWRGVLIG